MLSLSPVPLRQLTSFLFRAEPPDAGGDFAAEDPLALDYIGQQIGLWILPRLTTRTNRAQAYAIVLYGLALADRAVREYGLSGDDDERERSFERWERTWALACIESRNGRIERGSDDVMRGIRGAQRAWSPGDGPLERDYPLISRQTELGNLGAYLTSLRGIGLVLPGTLRPSPAADEVLAAFWDEPKEGDGGRAFDTFAFAMLDPKEMRIPRKYQKATLRSFGERSRLSALRARQRTDQQDRLYRALFADARDPNTFAVSELVRRACKDIETELRPESFLRAAIAGRFGKVDDGLRALLDTALRFGRVASGLLTAFNRAFATIVGRGFVCDRDTAIRGAFPDDSLASLHDACLQLLEAERASQIRLLPLHGGPFMRLVETLTTTTRAAALGAILDFHARVQKDRYRGAAWLHEHEGRLVVDLTRYRPRDDEAPFPAFKLPVVRQLLVDLGRIA